MNTVLKITRTELRNLFYSPVAWFLTIAFFVQSAVFYLASLAPIAKAQDLMLSNSPKFKDFGIPMTQVIFLSQDGIFNSALQNLFLYVPLLTMGLISREVNSGTIKLLYSSPVRVRQIVMGKYLAIVAYNLLLVSIIAIFMVTGAFNIHAVDYGLLLSALLGFFLLICAYTAIGLFMSSLTTYQIVSAIGSFIVVFVLSRIGGFWQRIDFVRDLTYFLSITGRTNKMVQGLITTKDVIYFVLITYMFVAFTLFKLKGDRESKPWFGKAVRYLLVIVSVLVMGYVSSRPTLVGYWDTTAGNDNTIHERTQAIIRSLGKDPLEVTLYTNILGLGAQYGFPENRNAYLSSLWERYTRFKPDIQFKYVYYYDVDDSAYYKTFPGKTLKQIEETIAGGYDFNPSLFEGPEQIRKAIDPVAENMRVVMQLSYKGRTTFLRTYNDAEFWPNEQETAAALDRLILDSIPKVYYVSGDLERNIHKTGEREYSLHSIEKLARMSLINLGFDADTVSLENREVPADARILVLADPKTTLRPATMERLQRYIRQGGNMYILGEPGKQAVLNPLLRQLGVQLADGTLVEPSANEMPHMLRPYLTPAFLNFAQEQDLFSAKTTGDTIKWLMEGATGLSYTSGGSPDSAFSIKPLMMSAAGRSWLKLGPLVTDSADVVYNQKEGDIQGSFPTALALNRPVGGREQRIVVCGDADFMSTVREGGAFVGRAIFCWLDDGKFPLYMPKPKPRDARLNVKPPAVAVMKIVYIWVLPAVLLAMGTILLIRRKRK